MSKVFISFLGLGNYSLANYDHGTLSGTPYVQSAIIEKHGAGFFDRIRILVTSGSCEKHWNTLKKEIECRIASHVHCEKVLISDDLLNDQWKWFETILSLVDTNDEVWFDMTHGYRAFSIVLSAALSFIQKTKNIKLMAVYYGAHEAPGTPIIDMKSFYQINEWADGVSQLIDSADTTKLAYLSESTIISTFSSLRDKDLINALNELSQIIRNVDVNHIAEKADKTLSLIKEKQKTCTGADFQLLTMVTEKFTSLSHSCPPSGKYDTAYFETQLALIEMLNKHGLYMQSFTVMRECIGSIGMLGAKDKHKRNMDNDNGRKGRNAADVFVNMIQYAENEWKFEGDTVSFKDHLKPFYDQLVELGIVSMLRSTIKTILDLRNGFNHCWTAAGPEKMKLLECVADHAMKCSKMLDNVVKNLKEKSIISG